MNLLTKQRETHQLWKGNYCCLLGKWQGVWEGHVYFAVFKMDNQQGLTV